MITFIKKNHSWTDEDRWGCANGYVAIPPNNPLNKIPRRMVYKLPTTQKVAFVIPASHWFYKPKHIPDDYLIIGFDTASTWSKPNENTKEWLEEQLKLFRQEIAEISESDKIYKLVAIHN